VPIGPLEASEFRESLPEAVGASLNIYSTKQEIDALLDGLSAARKYA